MRAAVKLNFSPHHQCLTEDFAFLCDGLYISNRGKAEAIQIPEILQVQYFDLQSLYQKNMLHIQTKT